MSLPEKVKNNMPYLVFFVSLLAIIIIDLSWLVNKFDEIEVDDNYIVEEISIDTYYSLVENKVIEDDEFLKSYNDNAFTSFNFKEGYSVSIGNRRNESMEAGNEEYKDFVNMKVEYERLEVNQVFKRLLAIAILVIASALLTMSTLRSFGYDSSRSLLV